MTENPLDRGLYALFSRHADRTRHARDRDHYRAANLATPFERFLARVYGLSWVAGLGAACWTALLVLLVPADLLASLVATVHGALPVLDRLPAPGLPRPAVALLVALLVGGLTKHLTVRAGGLYLRWLASARQSDIERTLPGAVRYLRALATGSDDRAAMLRKVANQDAYGETSAAFGRVLTRAELSGSLDAALRRTARDTPSRDLLAPFLLKFQEHASTGSDALSGYLEMESRMLSHRQARARQRAQDFLELVAELFIVLLVLPALLVIILTVIAVLAPGLSSEVATPLGPVTVRALAVAGAGGFALLVGAGAALVVMQLRPPDQSPPEYERPGGLATFATATTNPASAVVPAGLFALLLGGLCWWLGYRPANVILLAYVAFGLPVGLVAVRRARLDDAKDREIKDVIHAVAGHMSLGRPFREAVETVAREVDSGPLQADVEDLAFTLGLTTGPDTAVREGALRRFTDRVGTPLARQTMGLVTGALEMGGETDAVFDTLQTEVGRLYHERKALRSAMLVYVAVGWTTALLVIGIVVAVNGNVLDGFSQLSAVSDAGGVAIDPDAVQPERDRWRFYLVTQATMLASGWFAGSAARGKYEALLHSAALVAVCYVVFAGAGML
ncbi:type II secretion system F family protein [Natronomonas sp. EA1]|uniref:type II secretion system F family protein n=1 Tax=Natronomonas sp. EA1 TaxID=3421655 RepID=UPI003EBFE9F8